jgi:hypothetical protein
MALVPLRFKPGINRDATRHGSEGFWFDCDKVRFRDGMPEVVGGWVRFSSAAVAGTCRAIFPWTTLAGEILLGVGTHLKYYVMRGGALYDVTPLRLTTSAGAVTFAATNGSSVLTVTHTAHGASLGDYVTFSGATGLGGVVTAGVLNTEHVVTRVVTSNSYEVTLGVAANASDSGNGGGSVVGAYQISTGLDTAILGVGWGADPWGFGGWGLPGTTPAGTGTLRVWSHDNFGEDLVICPVNGGVYYWDSSAGLTARATPLSTLAGAQAAPTIARWVMVSDRDRHVICFGCDGETSPGVQDPLLIRWSDQENAAEWRTTTTTTAGEIRLSSGSQIITAIQTKREIVVFTDASLHSMQYLGAPYTFGAQDISRGIQIVSAYAAVAANDVVYWMSPGKFMMYDGVVRSIPCTVDDYVFSDFNWLQRQKVATGHNLRFSEIWWFYPSATSDVNDRYVVYNYEQNIWYYGQLARTAWASSGILDYPLAAGQDGFLYEHENGYNDGSQSPAAGIPAYIESSSLDIGEGDRFFFSRRVIPDITFRASTGSPEAMMTLRAFRFPGSSITDVDSPSVVQSATFPVEQYTDQMHIRLRGRSFALRVESNQLNTSWRLGVPRVDLRTDGER